MEPGPELDAAVATRVMGWTLVPLGYTPGAWADDDGIVVEKDKWSPSTDLRAAGEVLDKVPMDILMMDSGEFWAVVCGTNHKGISTISRQHAIALAALAAAEEKT